MGTVTELNPRLLAIAEAGAAKAVHALTDWITAILEGS